MALVNGDRIKESSSTVGLGSYSLSGPASGYQSFVAGVGGGNSTYYCAFNGTDWEVGLGTVTDSSPDTLSRTTILSSSNAGAAVNWPAGTKTVFGTLPAEAWDAIAGGASNIITVPAGTGTVSGDEAIWADVADQLDGSFGAEVVASGDYLIDGSIEITNAVQPKFRFTNFELHQRGRFQKSIILTACHAPVFIQGKIHGLPAYELDTLAPGIRPTEWGYDGSAPYNPADPDATFTPTDGIWGGAAGISLQDCTGTALLQDVEFDRIVGADIHLQGSSAKIERVKIRGISADWIEVGDNSADFPIIATGGTTEAGLLTNEVDVEITGCDFADKAMGSIYDFCIRRLVIHDNAAIGAIGQHGRYGSGGTLEFHVYSQKFKNCGQFAIKQAVDNSRAYAAPVYATSHSYITGTIVRVIPSGLSEYHLYRAVNDFTSVNFATDLGAGHWTFDQERMTPQAHFIDDDVEIEDCGYGIAYGLQNNGLNAETYFGGRIAAKVTRVNYAAALERWKGAVDIEADTCAEVAVQGYFEGIINLKTVGCPAGALSFTPSGPTFLNVKALNCGDASHVPVVILNPSAIAAGKALPLSGVEKPVVRPNYDLAWSASDCPNATLATNGNETYVLNPVVKAAKNTFTSTPAVSTATLTWTNRIDYPQTLINQVLTTPDINGGTADSLTSLSIRSTAASFDMLFANTEVLTANRTLNIKLNNATRALDFAGDVTLAGAFTTTNLTTLVSPTTIGDIWYCDSVGRMTWLHAVATGNVLLAGGVGAAPSWGKVTSSHLSGTANRLFGTDGSGNGAHVTMPAAGLTISSSALSFANDLAALEGLSSTGFAARTATDTWAQRSLAAPAAGFTITNPAGVAGDPTFVLADDLAALEALSGTNTIYYRSAANTWTAVTIAASLSFSGGTLGLATPVSIANGGTGAGTAAAAATALGLGTGDSPQFTAVNIGNVSDTTITRTGAGDIAVEGNTIYRAGGTDVPVADGGTGSSTAAGAATNLGLGTGDSPQHAAVNIGHATDTTVDRVAAGRIQVEGKGLVRGPASATDTAIAIYDGTTGDLVKNSLATVDVSGVLGGTSFSVASAGYMLWNSRSLIFSPADGIFKLINNGGSDFSRLQLGGETSSFPSLKRSGTGLIARLADDSANAPFTAASLTLTSPLTIGNGGMGAALGGLMLIGQALAVNANSVADTAVTVQLPAGITNYRINNIIIQNTGTTASLTTAHLAIYSAAAAGGTAVLGDIALSSLTSNAVNGATNSKVVGATEGIFNFATLYVRITTAQGAAATVNVYITAMPAA